MINFLPADVYWSDRLTPQIVEKIVQAATAAEYKRLAADAENWGNALNSAGWEMQDAYMEHTGATYVPVLLFNNSKAILRDAISEYFKKLNE